MDLQHTFTVPIGIDAAWEAFSDIERIAPCLPGAAITSVDGDDFTGTAKVKLGPISLQYSGTGRWVSRDRDSYSAVIEAQGKDKRGNGTAGATISARLEPDADRTRVVVDTALKVTGRPAQFGRGVMEEVGGKLLDQFAACLATRLAEPVGAPEPAPAASAASAPEVTPVPEAGAEAEVGAGAGAPGEAPPGPAAAQAAPSFAGEAHRAGGPTSSPGPHAHEPTELDLGGVVGPALLKRLAPVVVGVVLLVLLVRRLRRR